MEIFSTIMKPVIKQTKINYHVYIQKLSNIQYGFKYTLLFNIMGKNKLFS